MGGRNDKQTKEKADMREEKKTTYNVEAFSCGRWEHCERLKSKKEAEISIKEREIRIGPKEYRIVREIITREVIQ